MGMYINPVGMTKEAWLEIYGTEINEPENMPSNHEDVYVCLVKNRSFSAAGVAFDARELAGFKAPDPRPKRWYRVKWTDVNEVNQKFPPT